MPKPTTATPNEAPSKPPPSKKPPHPGTARDKRRREAKLAIAQRMELVPRPDLLRPLWTKGRPTKLTPEITERLVTALASGIHLETACDLVQLHRATVFDWLDRGRKDAEAGIDSDHARFSDCVSRAMADAEASIVRAITLAVSGLIPERPGYYPPDPKAGIQFLQIRYRDRYRKQTMFDITGPTEAAAPVQINVYIPAEDEPAPVVVQAAPNPPAWRAKLPPGNGHGNGSNGNGSGY